MQQKEIAENAKVMLDKNKVWSKPIVTEIVPITAYFRAEDYHVNYFERNPSNLYCQAVVRPKVEKFKKVFENLLK
jgi:peptide-methionine (S)-S-oxide reductase